MGTVEVEAKPTRGRNPSDSPVVSFVLRHAHVQWLDDLAGDRGMSRSEALRAVLDEAMRRERE